jgi:Family of unknown function (DUF6130)
MTAPASNALSPTALQIRGPAPVIPLDTEPLAEIIVDPPLPDALARGLVVIQYRTENLHIVPVFGSGAIDVSPRIGHLHITVDDGPWHWVDASGEPLIVQGLSPGPHRVLLELADPMHRVIDHAVVDLVIPQKRQPPESGSSAP